MVVLDTNVVSEAIKRDPSADVLAWLERQPDGILFTTAITQAELLYGVELMPKGRRRTELDDAITRILAKAFPDHILPFDSDAAKAYARIAASCRAMGKPIASADAQIAAIAISRGAKLATRNIRDFAHCGIKVINPWDE